MRPAPPSFRSFVLLVCVALAGVAVLGACHSTRRVSEVNANTQVRETMALLERGLQQVGIAAGLETIQAWQFRLREADDPALDDVADMLDDLEVELQVEGPVDGAEVGDLVRRLGGQTRAVAGRSSAPERLDRLGRLLNEAGERLR